tara:strand:+ start:70 stop:438 length:369 start_codon:yes stop_codon:yes gene_type:complete
MSTGVNKVILIGNLGQDPEVRPTPSGTMTTSFSMATSRTYKDKTGEKQQETQWHKIITWGKLAEFCGEYLSKGKSIYIEGRIEYRTWQDKEGNKRNTTEIVADTVNFVGSKNDSNHSRSDNW